MNHCKIFKQVLHVFLLHKSGNTTISVTYAQADMKYIVNSLVTSFYQSEKFSVWYL